MVLCLPAAGWVEKQQEHLCLEMVHGRTGQLVAEPVSGKEGRAVQPAAESAGLRAFAEPAPRAQPPAINMAGKEKNQVSNSGFHD